jgi:hypothetical protein
MERERGEGGRDREGGEGDRGRGSGRDGEGGGGTEGCLVRTHTLFRMYMYTYIHTYIHMVHRTYIYIYIYNILHSGRAVAPREAGLHRDWILGRQGNYI